MKGILGLLAAFVISFSVYATECEAPMSNERFTSLYESVEIKQHDQQRYRLIVAYAQRECFSVDQLSKVLKLVEEQKVRASIVYEVYANLFDKDNVQKLTTEFTDQQKAMIQKAIDRK
jgi:predicted DNA binding protein